MPRTVYLPKFKMKNYCLSIICPELPVAFKNTYFFDATACLKYQYNNKWLIHLMKMAEHYRVPYRECEGNKIAHQPTRKGIWTSIYRTWIDMNLRNNYQVCYQVMKNRQHQEHQQSMTLPTHFKPSFKNPQLKEPRNYQNWRTTT